METDMEITGGVTAVGGSSVEIRMVAKCDHASVGSWLEVSERSERALMKRQNTRDESREMVTDGKHPTNLKVHLASLGARCSVLGAGVFHFCGSRQRDQPTVSGCEAVS